MTQEISITSVDYARSLVTYSVGNPTGLAVTMGFSTSRNISPVLNTYVPAAWESVVGPPYYVICLVGIGGAITLPQGFYFKWIHVVNTPQLPAFPAGTLRITP